MAEISDRTDRGSVDPPEERWSFGGATAIEAAHGILLPEALVIGPHHAVLQADWRPGAAAVDLAFPQVPEFDDVIVVNDVIVVDDRGARYALHIEAMWDTGEPSGQTAWPMAMLLGLDPVPGREVGWLELRGQDGTTTRLLPSARPAVRVGQPTPAVMNPAEQELSGMLAAAGRGDGPPHHLDIGVALPPIDGVTVQVDSLFSGPGSWRLYLRAMPGWWKYSEDRRRKWSPVSVHAEDDRGGTYVSDYGGGTGHRDHEELALRFRPRLDPLAQALKLTLRGASEEVPVTLGLKTAADSQLE